MDTVEEIRSIGFAFEDGVTAGLHAASRTDTRAQYMADFVASACRPGLHAEIRAYVRHFRKA